MMMIDVESWVYIWVYITCKNNIYSPVLLHSHNSRSHNYAGENAPDEMEKKWKKT